MSDAKVENLLEAALTQTAHVRDDLHKMRSRAINKSSESLHLLKYAQTALSRTPPKLDVARDHIERAVASLEDLYFYATEPKQ